MPSPSSYLLGLYQGRCLLHPAFLSILNASALTVLQQRSNKIEHQKESTSSDKDTKFLCRHESRHVHCLIVATKCKCNVCPRFHSVSNFKIHFMATKEHVGERSNSWKIFCNTQLNTTHTQTTIIHIRP